jgi:hypothetical protein
MAISISFQAASSSEAKILEKVFVPSLMMTANSTNNDPLRRTQIFLRLAMALSIRSRPTYRQSKPSTNTASLPGANLPLLSSDVFEIPMLS